jgi:hypothetical protein
MGFIFERVTGSYNFHQPSIMRGHQGRDLSRFRGMMNTQRLGAIFSDALHRHAVAGPGLGNRAACRAVVHFSSSAITKEKISS